MILATVTTSILLSTASISTPGASPTARYIAEQVEERRRRLQESYSFGQDSKAAFEQLFSVASECSQPGWDGYGAAAVSDDTFRQAYRFLEALPLGMRQPSIGAEPDGHLTMEWYRSPRRTLSVSVSPEGDLHYSAILGLNKAYGTEVFLGDIPKTILELVRRVLTE